MSLGNRIRALAFVRIFATALKAWWDDDAPRLGAALAYYTLFAIAPVLLVATGIASLVFNTDAVRGEVVNQLALSGTRVRTPYKVFSMERVNDERASSPPRSAASRSSSPPPARFSSSRRR